MFLLAIAHTASKAESLKNEGKGLVEIFEADLHNADSVAKAAEGIEVVFLMTPPGQTHKAATIGDEEVRKSATSFLPPQFVEGYVNMYQYFAAGKYDQHHDDLEKLTGNKGRSLKGFFTANAAAFQ